MAARARQTAQNPLAMDAAVAARPQEDGLPPDLLWSSDEEGSDGEPGEGAGRRGREKVVARPGMDGSVPPRFLGPRGWTGLVAAVAIAVCVWCAPMADTLVLSLLCVSVGPQGVYMQGLGSVTPPDDSASAASDSPGSLRASTGGNDTVGMTSDSGGGDSLTIQVLLFDLGARCDAPAVVGLQVGFAGPLLLLLLVALPAAMLLSLPQNFPLLARLYRCTSGIGREAQQARPLCCAPGAGKSAGATATRVGGQVMMARPGDVMKAELARRRAKREREQREREAVKRAGDQAQPGWCGTKPLCDCDCCCWESSARAGSGRHQRKGCWRRTCSPPEGCGTRYTHVRPDGELLQDGDDPDAPWPLWWGAWLAGMRVKKYAWWAPLLLVRQAIMSISTAALAGAGTRVQAYGLLGVLSCSVIAQALTRPYVTKWLNGLELSCLLVQATSVLLGLLAYDDGVDSNARGGFGYTVLVLNLAPVAAAVLTALYVALLGACAAYSAGHCAFLCPCVASPDDNQDGNDGTGDKKGSDEFSMEAGEAVSGLALAARARRKEQARAARAAKKEAEEIRKQRIANLTAGANPMTLGSGDASGADRDGDGSGGRSSLIRAAANQNAAMRPIDEAAGVNPLLGLS